MQKGNSRELWQVVKIKNKSKSKSRTKIGPLKDKNKKLVTGDREMQMN